MKLTFRWYGEDDPVTLSHIRQIPGMSGIVSAVYDVRPGEVWSVESIRAIKEKAAINGNRAGYEGHGGGGLHPFEV